MNSEIFYIPKRIPHAKIRLFLFPYAGGSISSYISWQNDFNNEVELVIVQPPGRGTRFFDTPYDNMSQIIDEIMLSTSLLCEKPSIFFGHSLGSRVAYETIAHLLARNLRLPIHLIASASKAAHIHVARKNIHALPDNEFIQALKELNGTPREILGNQDLMLLFLPTLRADFKIAESYLAEGKQIPIPITALGGEQDVDVKQEHLIAWKELTLSTFNYKTIPGDHFFIDTHRQVVTREVNNIILQELKAHTIIQNKLQNAILQL